MSQILRPLELRAVSFDAWQSADGQNENFGAKLGENADEGGAAHAGHVDIGDHESDFSEVGLEEFDCLDPIAGHQYPVAIFREDNGKILPDRLVVFRDKNEF